MADNPKISQIKLPNGSTYDIKDNISGYTNNTGTITSVKTTAGAHTAINVSSGAAEFNVPTKTSHLTNDSGFLTSSDIASVLTYKGTKASVANLPSTGNKTGDVWHITADGSEYAWDGTIWQELGTTIDLSGYATKATTLAGYGIADAKIQNGTITLGSNSITPLTSFTETDPVFSASAAAGITSTDISNWNAKVSDDKTWNNKSLNMSTTTGNNFYVPRFNSTSADTAYLTLFTATPTASCGVRYDGSAYIYSTTPSANDNSTKVATTAYVDAAVGGITVPTKTSDLTNDSGFITSYTDEKLAVSEAEEGTPYALLMGRLTFTQASTRQYDTGGLRYSTINSGTDRYALLQLGNSTTASNGGKYGRIWIYGSGVNYINFRTDSLTANQTIYLPDKTGTIALTSDIPKVYSSTNTGGYLTMATLPIYDGTVV